MLAAAWYNRGVRWPGMPPTLGAGHETTADVVKPSQKGTWYPRPACMRVDTAKARPNEQAVGMGCQALERRHRVLFASEDATK